MSRPASRWLLGWAAFVVVNGLILNRRHNGSTLSECTRLVFRTDTRLGRIVFLLFWAALTRWLVPHILRPAKT